MQHRLEIIKKIAEENGGFVQTFQIEAMGISRPMIKKYVEAGKLKIIRKGLYMISDEIPDEYVVIQKCCSKAIHSYGTALYLWGMSDRIPHILDVTVPQGTNVLHLKKIYDNLRAHYTKKDWYEIGITQTSTPQGGEVFLYDKERCICDLIRDKDKVEMQVYEQAIKGYFKGKTNERKLIKYSRIFNIEKQVRTYLEVLE